MVWALRYLGAPVDVELGHDDLAEPGLLVGGAGVLAVTRADDARLQELVDANERNPTWELLWGSTGSILAAKATGLEWRRSAEILLAEWDAADDGLWTQTIVGKAGEVPRPGARLRRQRACAARVSLRRRAARADRARAARARGLGR